MKKRIVIYLVAMVTLINLFALGTIVYLQWRNSPQVIKKAQQELRFERVKRELGLSPQQVQQFETIRASFHAGLDSLDRKMEALQKQLLQIVWQAEADSARLDSILNEMAQIQTDSQQRVIRHFYQFKEILTLEQWQKFYVIVSERFPAARRFQGRHDKPKNE